MNKQTKGSIKRGVRAGVVWGLFLIIVGVGLTYLSDIGFFNENADRGPLGFIVKEQETSAPKKRQPYIWELPNTVTFNITSKSEIGNQYDGGSSVEENRYEKADPRTWEPGQVILVEIDDPNKLNIISAERLILVQGVDSELGYKIEMKEPASGRAGWMTLTNFRGVFVKVEGNKLTATCEE